MKRIVRLTESDLTRIVRRVISEQTQGDVMAKYGIETAERDETNPMRFSYMKVGGSRYITYDCKEKKFYKDDVVAPQQAAYTSQQEFVKAYCAILSKVGF